MYTRLPLGAKVFRDTSVQQSRLEQPLTRLLGMGRQMPPCGWYLLARALHTRSKPPKVKAPSVTRDVTRVIGSSQRIERIVALKRSSSFPGVTTT